MSNTSHRSIPRAAALAAAALLAILFHAGAARAQWATSGNNINNTNTGNVGVGTAAPAFRLHVEGASTDDNYFVQGYFKNTNAALPYGGVAVDGQSQSHVRFMLGGSLKWQWRVGAGTGVDDLRAYNFSLGRDVLTLTNTGNVGIGTTNPHYTLELSGATAPILALSDTGLAHGITGMAQTDTFFKAEQVTNDHGGVRLSGFSDTAGLNPMRIIGSFGSTDPTDTVPAIWLIGNKRNGTSTTNLGATETVLQVSQDNGTTHLVTILGSGNVGIGTTNPTEKLHVAGNINVTGNIAAKYQDVAEWVPSTQKLAAGTLVVLDPDNSNHVLASTKPYDTRVAGVISSQPGIALGEKGESKVLVATTGRVRINVDATKGPIHIGDLLVTSDMPGVAMRSEPVNIGGVQLHRPGTLIGKALEPLAKGTGEILVLLSLQ